MCVQTYSWCTSIDGSPDSSLKTARVPLRPLPMKKTGVVSLAMGSEHDTAVGQHLQHRLHGIVDGDLIGLELEIRMLRRLVRVADAREERASASLRLAIHPFRVPLDADVERRVHEHLEDVRRGVL